MMADSREFDITGRDFRRDPLPTFARMRAVGPVVKAKVPIFGALHFATTYEACVALLKDSDRFAVDARNAGKSAVMGLRWLPKRIRILAENMLSKDDPDHRRLRHLVDSAFNRKSVEAYGDRIAEIADRLIDDLARSPDKDFVSRVARPLPLAVICELLGLPDEDRPKFIRWMASMTEVTSILSFYKFLPAIGRLSRYMKERFEERRRAPADDLISHLVAARDAGDSLSEDELLAMTFLLFAAGHETTTHLMSGGILALLQNPDQLEELKADWSIAPMAVEELLRFVSPVQMTKPRFAKRDLEFAGVDLRRGEPVMALLASANSDPAEFDAPEKLILTRERNRHIAFGSGPHFCLGLQLARAEMRIMMERLIHRFADLELAVRAHELRWRKRAGLRALERLPLRLQG